MHAVSTASHPWTTLDGEMDDFQRFIRLGKHQDANPERGLA